MDDVGVERRINGKGAELLAQKTRRGGRVQNYDIRSCKLKGSFIDDIATVDIAVRSFLR